VLFTGCDSDSLETFEPQAALELGGERVLALAGSGRRLWLCLPSTDTNSGARDAAALTPHALRVAAGETLTCFHLVEGTSEHVPATAEAIQQARGRTAGPALFVAQPGGDKTGKEAQ